MLTAEQRHQNAMKAAEASKAARAARRLEGEKAEAVRERGRARPPVHVLGGGDGSLVRLFKAAWVALYHQYSEPPEGHRVLGLVTQAAVEKAQMDLATAAYGQASSRLEAGGKGAPTQAEVNALARAREAASDRWDAAMARLDKAAAPFMVDEIGSPLYDYDDPA